MDQVQTSPAPTSGSSTARPVTADSSPSQPNGAVSNSRWLIAAWSMPVRSSRAASSWVPGAVLPNRKEPVSAASPAYRQVASRWSSVDVEPVEQPGDQHHGGGRRRVDQPQLAEAGVAGVVVDDDRPAGACPAAPARSPSRPADAASRLTNTSTSAGHLRGRHELVGAGEPGQRPGQRERLGERGTTRAPRRRSALGQRQGAAQRVGVGLDVPGEHHRRPGGRGPGEHLDRGGGLRRDGVGHRRHGVAVGPGVGDRGGVGLLLHPAPAHRVAGAVVGLVGGDAVGRADLAALAAGRRVTGARLLAPAERRPGRGPGRVEGIGVDGLGHDALRWAADGPPSAKSSVRPSAPRRR